MVIALVLQRDFDVLPPHVEYGNELAVFAMNGDLGLGPRVASFDEQQPQPGLSGGLRAGVDQRQCMSCAPDVAVAFVAVGDRLDIGNLESGCPGERIDGRDCLDERISAREILGGTGRSGYGYAGDRLDFVVSHAIQPGVNAGWRTTVLVQQLHWCLRVDPLGAVQG